MTLHDAGCGSEINFRSFGVYKFVLRCVCLMWRRNAGMVTMERVHDESGHEKGGVISSCSALQGALTERSEELRPALSSVTTWCRAVCKIENAVWHTGHTLVTVFVVALSLRPVVPSTSVACTSSAALPRTISNLCTTCSLHGPALRVRHPPHRSRASVFCSHWWSGQAPEFCSHNLGKYPSTGNISSCFFIWGG